MQNARGTCRGEFRARLGIGPKPYLPDFGQPGCTKEVEGCRPNYEREWIPSGVRRIFPSVSTKYSLTAPSAAAILERRLIFWVA